MIHTIFLILHIAGMLGILGIGFYLLLKKNLESNSRVKTATYLISAAHTQLLTGFILFFIMISQVNHVKIGIKMLLAIVISVVSTIYKKKVSAGQQPSPVLLPIIVVTGVDVTAIAFLL